MDTKNDVEIFSTHNEVKRVVAERFIKIIQKKYNYITSVSKNEYLSKLKDIVRTYNNTYHRTIKMEPADVNLKTYIDSNKENNQKGFEFKVGDHVRTSKHKNIFARGYVTNCSEDVLVITKLKILFRGHVL